MEETSPTTSAPRPATPQLSQAQILDATAECLREHGYDGTTIRRIASRLGCAVGSIYRYCDDKRTLLAIVTQRRFEPVLQAIEDHRPVAHSVRLYAQVATEAAEQYRLMFWLATAPADPAPGATNRPLPEVIAQIIDGWSRQIGDPRAAQRLWAQLHGGLALALSIEPLMHDLTHSFEFLAQRGDHAAAGDDGQTEAPAFAPPRTEAGVDGVYAAGAARGEREDLTML